LAFLLGDHLAILLLVIIKPLEKRSPESDMAKKTKSQKSNLKQEYE
jgi:hypothetical protein